MVSPCDWVATAAVACATSLKIASNVGGVVVITMANPLNQRLVEDEESKHELKQVSTTFQLREYSECSP